MSFIQRELDRVSAKLQAGPLADEDRDQLYAVQQALLWALDPTGFKSPYDMIMISDTPAGSEDCQAGSGRSRSSDSLDLHVP